MGVCSSCFPTRQEGESGDLISQDLVQWGQVPEGQKKRKAFFGSLSVLAPLSKGLPSGDL
jgi:hypothetical protein